MRYREVGLLAEGGMALVQKAVADDGTCVVVKRVRPPYCFDASYLKLFADEGAVHAALADAHIVRLLDRGEDEAGPFLVFEHVDGVDLGHIQEHQKGAPLPLPAVLSLFIPLMKGLAAAHEARDPQGAPLQLVHRDVSPGNILVGVDGCVKLADFGVAASTLRQEATVAGEMKGKFAYMAPEQTRGQRVSALADLFSAGIVLWECLAGRKLFEGPTDADVVHAVRETPAPSLDDVAPGLPAELVALVARLLRKDPADRPATAREVQRALQDVALNQGLDEGLARHAARLVRETPQRDVVVRDMDQRRRTQRVVGETNATGVLVVRQRSAPRRALLAVGGTAALAAAAALLVTSAAGAGSSSGDTVRVVQLAETPARSPVAPPTAAIPAAPAPSPTEPATASPPTAARPRRPATAPSAAISAPTAGPQGVGTLSIATEPWASVTVDGALVKTETPLRKLPLPAGRHVIRLQNSFYKIDKTVELTIVPGQELRRFFNLNP